jgi:hypothetical protein
MHTYYFTLTVTGGAVDRVQEFLASTPAEQPVGQLAPPWWSRAMPGSTALWPWRWWGR